MYESQSTELQCYIHPFMSVLSLQIMNISVSPTVLN